MNLQQVCDHFAVGFTCKSVACTNQLFLQLLVIFDNPVVNNRDIVLAGRMGVSILVCHAAVRCPARVSDTDLARHLVDVQVLVHFEDLAGPLAYKDAAAVKGGDADAVVAPIFHSLQAVN